MRSSYYIRRKKPAFSENQLNELALSLPESRQNKIGPASDIIQFIDTEEQVVLSFTSIGTTDLGIKYYHLDRPNLDADKLSELLHNADYTLKRALLSEALEQKAEIMRVDEPDTFRSGSWVARECKRILHGDRIGSFLAC